VSSYHPLRTRTGQLTRAAAPLLREHAAWAWEQAFPGTLEQVRHVRGAVRPLLQDCPAADDLVLMVSELSANAIAHSRSSRPGGTFTVRLRHLPCSCVHGEVEDEGSAWDGDLDTSARNASGLFLVLKFASACGVAPGTANGRVVWFRRECSVRSGNLTIPLGVTGLITADLEAAGRLLAAPPQARTAGGIAKEQPDDR
jgi:anti-sigma regulatory factor (Ser/Thr protein kinase)